MAKKKIFDAAKDTGIDLAIGLGGAVGGAFLGKLSLFAGSALMMYGHSQDKEWAKKAGLTAALVGGYNTVAPAAKQTQVSGLDDAENYGEEMQGIDGFSISNFIKGGNERVKNFLSVVKEKVMPFSTTAKSNTTNGIGEAETLYMNPFAGLNETEIMGTTEGLNNTEIMGTIGDTEIMGSIAEEQEVGETVGNIW